MNLNLSLLTMFSLLIICCFTLGCEKNLIPDIIPPPDIDDTCTIEHDIQSCNGIAYPSSLETSRWIMEDINWKRRKVYEDAQTTGDFTILPEASDAIFEEILLGFFGFDERGFAMKLITVWEETFRVRHQAGEVDDVAAERYDNFRNTFLEKVESENGEPYFEFIGAYDDIIAEYLRIALEYEFAGLYQNKPIELFRKSMQQGNADIIYPEGF